MSESRTHTLTGSLAADGIFKQLKGYERISRPFTYLIEFLSKKSDIAPIDVVGRSFGVKVKLEDSIERYIDGIVTRFRLVGKSGNYFVYHAEIRPWLWLLSHTEDCRIFQNKSIPEILNLIFKDKHGFTDFKLKLTGTYSPLEYCVQYRESDLDFVSRLMEKAGIYYYFVHESGKHTLTASDSPSQTPPISGTLELPYRPESQTTDRIEYVSAWQHRIQIQPSKFVYRDYDYNKPNVNLEVRATASGNNAIGHLERYAYPGQYAETDDGRNFLQVLADGVAVQSNEVEAYANCYRLAPGHKFKLTEHTVAGQNGDYMVVGAELTITSGEIEHLKSNSKNSIAVEFHCVDAKSDYRAPMETRKPIIAGPQTAVVVGKENEDIWTDSLGRVKVQFPWDREGKKDENSSCWIRVAQLWAGKSWGGINVPRTGQEVVVEFLEGDPDRPLITGRVYNTDQTVPYALPDNAHQSGVKTQSTPDGTGETFNELRFTDKKGEEEVYFHAEKNFVRVVENDDSLTVGMEKKDSGNQTITIHNDQTITIGNNESEGGSQTLTVWKNQTSTVSTGDRTATIEKGNDTLTVSKGNLTIDVTQGECKITAGNKILLTVGGSSIEITSSGIKIAASQIELTADMKFAASGSTSSVEGSSALTLKGGVVKIN